MSNQAIMFTTILGLFGLVLMALALYQLALILQHQVDMEHVRRESAVRISAAPTVRLSDTWQRSSA